MIKGIYAPKGMGERKRTARSRAGRFVVLLIAALALLFCGKSAAYGETAGNINETASGLGGFGLAEKEQEVAAQAARLLENSGFSGGDLIRKMEIRSKEDTPPGKCFSVKVTYDSGKKAELFLCVPAADTGRRNISQRAFFMWPPPMPSSSNQ